MKVAGFVGKCERTAGSQQGDIIACRVATMGEVTHARPHISGKDGGGGGGGVGPVGFVVYLKLQMYSSLHVYIVPLHSHAHNASGFCVRLRIVSLSVCLLCHNVCVPVCVRGFTPAFAFLLSTACTK